MRSAATPLVVLVAVILAAGCGGDDGQGIADEASLTEVPWLLVAGVDVDGWESVAPSAVFGAGAVAGSTGCNRYTGPYSIDGDELEIGTLAVTRMACAPPADAVERDYVAALERVRGWRIEEPELLLLGEDGEELLRYGEATPLGDWEATAVASATALSSPLPGTTITARFADDGTLTGSAGCNTYRTDFTTEGGEIEVGPAAATEKLCSAPDGVMAQETAFLESLTTVTRFRVDGGTLSLLRNDDTTVATFTRS